MLTFNKEQLTCLEAPEDKIIVNASAGTGKTSTLVEAAKRKAGVHRDVVVITFTNEAAEQIKRGVYNFPEFVGTIHAFALREINYIKKKHMFKTKLLEEKEIKKLMTQALAETIGVAKNYKEVLARALGGITGRAAYEDSKEFHQSQKILKRYVALKKKYNVYDYTDTPQYLVELIEQYNWELPYRNYFVDEIQDIDIHEFNLISKFEGYCFLIGDPRQTIYIFRNSLLDIFDKFEKIGYNEYILTENYRSYQEILDRAGATLDAKRGYGGLVTDHSLILSNPDSIILCRTNKELVELEKYFTNVSTVHGFKGLEADDVVVVDFQIGSQESKNIMFVALTRARNRLGIANYNDLIKIGRKIKNGY